MKHGSSGAGLGDHLHPSGPATAEERLAAYLRTREGSLNTSTERALRADMQVFLEWCAERRFEALPARPSTVAAFMRDMALQKAASTVRRYVYNLSALHKALGEENPAEAAEVKLALRQLVPAKRGGENGALGLTWTLCQRLIEVPGDRLIDSRNRALLAVAYDALLRRSELVSLQAASLLVEGGASATLPAPRGTGEKDLVFHLAGDTLKLVEVWLQRAGDQRGAAVPLAAQGRVSGGEARREPSAAHFQAHGAPGRPDAGNYSPPVGPQSACWSGPGHARKRCAIAGDLARGTLEECGHGTALRGAPVGGEDRLRPAGGNPAERFLPNESVLVAREGVPPRLGGDQTRIRVPQLQHLMEQAGADPAYPRLKKSTQLIPP